MLHFLCIGAQKAGTTWLYDKLSQHPLISFPGGKEVHFWDQCPEKGLDWYRDLFDLPDGKLHGDMTPAYSALPLETVRQIREWFPHLRIVYILRDPIERAWSSAIMSLEFCMMRVEEASDRWFIDHFNSDASRSRGDYAACLDVWSATFPPQSLLVLRFEDIRSDPEGFLAKVCAHLGVVPDFPNFRIPLEVSIHQGVPTPIRPSLLPTLHALYDHKIVALETRLGWDLSSWRRCRSRALAPAEPPRHGGEGTGRNRAVVLVGMHRSGTSVLSRALEVIRVDLGTNLVSADAYNTKGYWEDRDLLSLNEEILITLGREWSDLGMVEEQKVAATCEGPLFGRAIEILESRLARGGLQGFKDPRFSLLLGFWKKAFHTVGIEPSYVLALRHPRAVADSLQRRNGMPSEQGVWLWASYILSALSGLQETPVLVVCYEEFLRNPRGGMERLSRFLGSPIAETRWDSFHDDFLAPTLNHAEEASQPLSDLVLEVFQSLRIASMTGIPLRSSDLPLKQWMSRYAAFGDLLTLANLNHRKIVSLGELAVERMEVVEQQRRLLSAVEPRSEGVLGPEAQTYSPASGDETSSGEATRDLAVRSRLVMTTSRLKRAAMEIVQRWHNRLDYRFRRLALSAGILHRHLNSGCFDAAWYAARHSNERGAAWFPLLHFSLVGIFKDYAPTPSFDAQTYLKINPDVAVKGTSAVLHYMLYGFQEARRLADEPAVLPEAAPEQTCVATRDYHQWIEEQEWMATRATMPSAGPCLSILLPVYKVPCAFLERAIASVLSQTYDNWELCIAFGDPDCEENLQLIRRLSSMEPRIQFKVMNNQGISGNTNRALEMARGEFIALLDHDDELAPFALADMARAIVEHPDADFLYSDKDSIDHESRTRMNALFKPRWSPDTLYSVNYLTHFNVIRRSLVEAVGGLRPETDGAQDWDLFLRVSEQSRRNLHVPGVHYHWRIHPGSTSAGIGAKPYALAAQLRVLEDAISRRGLPADVVPHPDSGFHVRWRSRTGTHVIVDARQGLSGQLASLLRRMPECASITVLAPEDECQDGNAESDSPRIRTVNPGSKPICRVLNEIVAGMGTAPGAVVFLSGQIRDISEPMIAELAGWAVLHPGIGFATGLVLDDDGRVLEAGLVVDANGKGSPLFRGSQLHDYGWLGGALWYRNCSACHPWAVAVRLEAFGEAGGFDEAYDWPEAFISLCCSLRGKGWRGLVDPHVRATLSADRAPPIPDFHCSLWNDPSFHPAFDSVAPLRLKRRTEFPSLGMEAAFHAEHCRASPEDIAIPSQHPEWFGHGAGAGWCNWFLPAIDYPSYGGAMTILRFADGMRRSRNVRQRFLFTTATDLERCRAAFTSLFPGLSGSEFLELPSGDDISVVPAADYSFATLWSTAYTLLRIRNTALKLYFIQDFEPLFYPAGSIQALASFTYEMGFYGITNTQPLRQIFERDYGGTAIHFVPQVDPRVFHAAPSRTGVPPARVFFYTRPGHPRNGFELLIIAMKRLKQQLGARVEIVCAGAEFDVNRYGLRGVAVNYGLLDYRKTAELYRSCHVGCVLMMTRHPSYLPMELMACGALLVTNHNPCNDWLLKDGENCLLAAAHPDALAERLAFAVTRYEQLAVVRDHGRTMVATKYSDWDSAFEPAFSFLDSLAPHPHRTRPGV